MFGYRSTGVRRQVVFSDVWHASHHTNSSPRQPFSHIGGLPLGDHQEEDNVPRRLQSWTRKRKQTLSTAEVAELLKLHSKLSGAQCTFCGAVTVCRGRVDHNRSVRSVSALSGNVRPMSKRTA